MGRGRRTAGAVFAALMVAALGGVAACGGCDDAGQGGDSGAEGADVAEIPEFDAGSIHTEKLTPETLLPVIQAIGFRGVVPKRVTVQFSRNVIDDAPRAAGEDTIFTIEPPTAGALSFTGNSTLEFEPRAGFLPATTYTVTLSSVGTRNGPLSALQPWSHEFTTPPFEFIGLSGAYLDERSGQVEVDMRFSAPVDPKVLERYADWEFNDASVGYVTYAAGTEPNVARVFLRGANIERGGTLRVELDEGVPYGDGGVTASAGDAQVVVEAGKPVSLFAAVRREGPEGYYIEVICKDESAPGGSRYYYDRTTYDSYRISRRCMPDAESVASIAFNPPIEFRVASGQGGFNLIGDFQRGNYTLKIDSGVRTIDGGVVRHPFERAITIPSRTPAIAFVDKGRYVPRSQWRRLAVNHLNVDEVEISVRHVPQQNAVFWMSGGSEAADERTSVLVAKERVKFSSKTDARTTSFVDVAKLVTDPKPGLYEVTVAGLGKKDAIRLVPTDMNLIVKRSATKPNQKWADEALVWAIDMKTLAPVSAVRIDLVRPSGDVVARCETDTTGGCKLEVPVDTLDPEPPFALIARKGDDFTYLEYADLKTEAGDSEVAGDAYLSQAAYHGTVWSDRGVYRPGETAHLVALLRTDDYVAPVGGVPVEVEVKDPRQRVLSTQVLKTNDAGVIALDQKFADFAATGVYTLEVEVAKKTVATYRFNVEEFVPERMRVETTIPTREFQAGEEIGVDISARYLFGGSAEGSKVELTCRVVPHTFEPQDNGEYYYGIASVEAKPLDLAVVTSTLGTDGASRLACPPLDAAARAHQTGRVEATAAVFEAGSGRTTTAMAKATVHPGRRYIGLKSGAQAASPGSPVTVEGIVVDWNGVVQTDLDEVEIEFVRLEREYWWYFDEEEGESNYGKNLRPVVEGTLTVPVKKGKFVVKRAPGESAASWIVAASAGTTRTELKFEGASDYSYYWDEDGYHRGRRDETPRPSRPTAMRIEAPESIGVQVPSPFTIHVPFKGRMLLTAETHEVLTHEWVDVEAGPFQWRFTLAEFTPNVYVSALLVKDPHLDSKKAFMPDRAFGVKSVRVEPSDRLHTVRLTAPTEVRPNSTLTVALDLGPRDTPTFATIAAVDEGILSLTRFETPAPSRELFAKRALGVETFETVGWALQSTPGGPSSKTGGGWDEDGEFGDGKGRLMPVKPVALWSGVVEVPPSGKTTVSFEVPRYRGALRVMAVTADATRTGSADAQVLVREPIVLQTTLPRFMSAGDELQIPVFVTNMSGSDQTIEVTFSAEHAATPGLTGEPAGPPVSLRGATTKTLVIPNGKSETAVFAVVGLQQAGAAKFSVTAAAPAYTAYDEGVVPFRPNGQHERRAHVVELSEGRNDLSKFLDGWVPTSEATNIWVTSIPHAEPFSHLRYLVRYPHGCIEQTTSTTRPLLYVSQLVSQLDPESLAKAGSVEAMVAAGIERILSMQTASGGFAYWPGGAHADDWGTTYATHLLLDAQKAGFAVPQDRLDSAVDYLDQSVTRRSSSSGQGYRHSEAYMHYVLARAGKGKKARVQRLIDQLPPKGTGQDAEKAYVLKAALYLAGDRRYEDELRRPDVSSFTEEREPRWSYYSDRRRRAFVLSMFFDMFGADEDGAKLARLVSSGLSEGRASRWYTTQELVWGVTALGKWFSGATASFGDAKLVLGGKRPRPQTESKTRADRAWSIYRASEYADPAIELNGKKGKVFAVITSEGVRTDSEPMIGGNGMRIQRRFFNAEGAEIEPDGHALGDLIYTEITVENLNTEPLYNLALVDRLPAGWEIENPRLGRGTLPEWVDEDGLWQPEHMNLRDDRLEAFGDLGARKTVKLVYAVRSVSAGRFFAPPPEIEAMYNPEMWARDEPALVKVRGPWDALID